MYPLLHGSDTFVVDTLIEIKFMRSKPSVILHKSNKLEIEFDGTRVEFVITLVIRVYNLGHGTSIWNLSYIFAF